MKSLSMEQDLEVVRMLSTLALLPVQEIELTFYQLVDKYQNNNNTSLFDYFKYEWIDRVILERIMIELT
jgi:hypothetical protein